MSSTKWGARGYLVWQHISAGPYTRNVPEAVESPDLSQFDEDEIRIIKATLQELAGHGGKSVSDWSHRESVGWNEVGEGEAIPYHSALFSTKPIPDEDLERAREMAVARNWASRP